MNRATLQTLADERAADAWALQYAHRWSACYYLAGYAVECALKACIAKRTRMYDFPDKKTVLDSHTHDIETLVRLAGLQGLVKIETDALTLLGQNWTIAKDWSEQARYQQWAEVAARKLLTAVNDSQTGVLPWIKAYW